jgi:hypothetical protein
MNHLCNGAGPHAAGEVKLMPLNGRGSLRLCRLCWERELSYRRHLIRSLDAWLRLPTWEEAQSVKT